jgi:hypothetical protein
MPGSLKHGVKKRVHIFSEKNLAVSTTSKTKMINIKLAVANLHLLIKITQKEKDFVFNTKHLDIYPWKITVNTGF